MTRADLLTLVSAIAHAAAEHVRATPAQTQRSVREHGPHFGDAIHGLPITRRVVLAARAGQWGASGSHRGAATLNGGAPEDAATAAAAVLALRERVQRQHLERSRLLDADAAALRVIDEMARIYSADVVREAVGRICPGDADEVSRVLRGLAYGVPGDAGPWTRADTARIGSDVRDACDEVIRERAGVAR